MIKYVANRAMLAAVAGGLLVSCKPSVDELANARIARLEETVESQSKVITDLVSDAARIGDRVDAIDSGRGAPAYLELDGGYFRLPTHFGPMLVSWDGIACSRENGAVVDLEIGNPDPLLPFPTLPW